MKFRNIAIALLSLILLFSCKEEKLVITDEKQENIPTSEEVSVTVPETERPLRIVLPEDVAEIVVRADGAPGMYLGEDGEVHGFYVDLEIMVMEEMGQAYKFFPYYDISEVYQGFKSGVYPIALAVPDVPDYRAAFQLSIPYEVLHYVTFVQNGNEDIAGETKEELIQSLFGKKVGVQTQGHILQSLRDYKEIELIEYETTTKALEALDKGDLDAVPDVQRIGEYYRKRNGWNIKPVGAPIISQKNTTGISNAVDPSFTERYNKALKGIIDDGRLKTLWESYFGEMRESDIP